MVMIVYLRLFRLLLTLRETSFLSFCESPTSSTCPVEISDLSHAWNICHSSLIFFFRVAQLSTYPNVYDVTYKVGLKGNGIVREWSFEDVFAV